MLFSKYNHEALDRKPVNSGTNSEIIISFSEEKLEAELMNVECQPHLSISFPIFPFNIQYFL